MIRSAFDDGSIYWGKSNGLLRKQYRIGEKPCEIFAAVIHVWKGIRHSQHGILCTGKGIVGQQLCPERARNFGNGNQVFLCVCNARNQRNPKNKVFSAGFQPFNIL